MLEKFIAFIEKHKLCRKSDHLLIAVSGGVDSMVMMDLFYKAGFGITILHCNFKLRGESADEDESFVIKVAKNYHVDCKSKKFNTQEYAEENKLSIQVAARELRYEWFKELLDIKVGDKLATAHHLNDQLETIIYHLSKGTGIEGMSGIPIKQGDIIRPLLSFSRKEIMEYALKNKLEWREDATNESIKYKRNFIRHKITPLLEEINPSLIDTFERTSKRLKEAEEVVQEAISLFKNEYLSRSDQDFVVEKDVLKSKNTTFIHLLFKQFGINYNQAEEIKVCLFSDQSGKLFYTNDYVLNIDRKDIFISRPEEDFPVYEVPEGFEGREYGFYFDIIPAADVVIDKSPDIAYINYSRLKFPLIIRRWNEGDKFKPLGMTGQKKLSDFMIDNKIPVNLKNRVLVLESEGEIVWVVGQRIDDRYKVTDNTSIIYKIKWLS